MKYNKLLSLLLLIVSILIISTVVFASGDSTKANSGDNKISSGESASNIKKYLITTELNNGGSISPENPRVEEGKSQLFTIKPNSNYRIKDVIVDGKSVGSVSTYTLNDIDKQHKIEVEFIKVYSEWKNRFEDVSFDDWFYNAVKYVNKNDIFDGISKTEFAPNENLTRGMLVTVLFRFSNAVEYTKSTFVDVPEDAYYSQAVSWASKNGIVNGIGDNKFNPNGNITRQDLATIIYRYARSKGVVYVMNISHILNYLDKDLISDYAFDAVCWCNTNKVLNGKTESMIDPIGYATRAETAAIMQRLADALD